MKLQFELKLSTLNTYQQQPEYDKYNFSILCSCFEVR